MQAVVAALHRVDGADPVGSVLVQLRSRRGEVAWALGGESLQAEVVLVGDGEEELHRLVFAPDGTVGRLRADGVLAERFRPHLTVRGGGTAVVELVLGEIDVARAVYRGLLTLHVPPTALVPRYPRLMRVVAAALLDVADQASWDPGGDSPDLE